MRRTFPLLLAIVGLGCFSEDVGGMAMGSDETGPVEMGTDGLDESSSSSSSSSAGSDDSGSDEAGVGDGDSAADSSGDPGVAPMILSLSVDPPSITAGGSVTVAALVTHPEGEQTIVGGSLESADGQIYGQFAYAQGGGFEVVVTWDTLAEIDAFTFAGEGWLPLTASFFDAYGAMTSDTIDVGLHCAAGEASPAVCGDGVCVDLDDDADHCGTCGSSCDVQAVDTMYEAGGCAGGTCQPLWQETCIVESDPWTTCDEYCAAQGLTCTPSCADEGARARFLSADDCEGFGVGAYSDLCDFAFTYHGDEDAYRCCCT